MELFSGLRLLESPERFAEVAFAAKESGIPTFVISTEGKAGTAGLFEAIRDVLPLDPMLHSFRVWDALSDSLWGGIDSLRQDYVVILWPDSKEFSVRWPEEFDIARSILEQVAETLGNGDFTQGEPTVVSVFLAS